MMYRLFRVVAMVLVVMHLSGAGTGAARQTHSAADGWFDRGGKLTEQGDLEGAYDAFSKAIEQKSRFIGEAYVSRGMVNERRGRLDEAIDDYSAAIRINRKFAQAYNNRGMILFSEQRYVAAVEDLDVAISLDDRNAAFHANRAAVYAKLKQHEKAIADYTASILIDPNNADAFAGRGAAYYAWGERSLAVKDLKMACDRGSEAGCRSLKAVSGGK